MNSGFDPTRARITAVEELPDHQVLITLDDGRQRVWDATSHLENSRRNRRKLPEPGEPLNPYFDDHDLRIEAGLFFPIRYVIADSVPWQDPNPMSGREPDPPSSNEEAEETEGLAEPLKMALALIVLVVLPISVLYGVMIVKVSPFNEREFWANLISLEAVFSGLALVALIVTLWYQISEFKLARGEFTAQSKALRMQVSEMERSRLETRIATLETRLLQARRSVARISLLLTEAERPEYVCALPGDIRLIFGDALSIYYASPRTFTYRDLYDLPDGSLGVDLYMGPSDPNAKLFLEYQDQYGERCTAMYRLYRQLTETEIRPYYASTIEDIENELQKCRMQLKRLVPFGS